LVDVFGSRRLAGNPLPVVIDARGLEGRDMLEITRWLNFSETTFLVPPESDEADYRVRIFTLAGELPFAGHPTLGTCHVWQSITGSDAAEVVQECGAGLVRLHRSGDVISFEAPALIRDGPVEHDDLARFAKVLGVDLSDIEAARWVDNGPGWVGILLEDAETVLGLEPDFSMAHGRLDIGVVGFHPDGSDRRYEVRAFFSNQRGEMVEDPVTGSLNASIAQWLIGEGRVEAPYLVGQGARVGRDGEVSISTDDAGTVWVGGRVFDMASGELE
jgi:PhzF family phenazine biosynthesis protein